MKAAGSRYEKYQRNDEKEEKKETVHRGEERKLEERGENNQDRGEKIQKRGEKKKSLAQEPGTTFCCPHGLRTTIGTSNRKYQVNVSSKRSSHRQCNDQLIESAGKLSADWLSADRQLSNSNQLIVNSRSNCQKIGKKNDTDCKRISISTSSGGQSIKCIKDWNRRQEKQEDNSPLVVKPNNYSSSYLLHQEINVSEDGKKKKRRIKR